MSLIWTLDSMEAGWVCQEWYSFLYPGFFLGIVQCQLNSKFLSTCFWISWKAQALFSMTSWIPFFKWCIKVGQYSFIPFYAILTTCLHRNLQYCGMQYLMLFQSKFWVLWCLCNCVWLRCSEEILWTFVLLWNPSFFAAIFHSVCQIYSFC